VVIPLHTQHFIMLQRNLLYTALTRGKKRWCCRQRQGAGAAVERQDTARRYTAWKWPCSARGGWRV